MCLITLCHTVQNSSKDNETQEKVVHYLDCIISGRSKQGPHSEDRKSLTCVPVLSDAECSDLRLLQERLWLGMESSSEGKADTVSTSTDIMVVFMGDLGLSWTIINNCVGDECSGLGFSDEKLKS